MWRVTADPWRVFSAAGVLLLVAASRLLRLNEIRMNPDEIWSVWQTFGTYQQILNWTPYDWPPLYYLVIGGWWRLTGLHPVGLRLLSLLVFMLGAAFLYRVGRRMFSHTGGLLAVLAYAGLGYAILLSIEVRGYALLLGLMPLALWLTLRYFERRRWYWGVLLGLVLAAMFYVSYTSTLAIMMLGLFMLLVDYRSVWRWWLPGGLTFALALPQILKIRETALQRVEATQTLTPGPLPEALYNLIWNWTGPLFPLWLLLLVVASVWIIRQGGRYRLALAVWVFAMPVLMYLLNPVLGFFSARYAWWIMIGWAVWLGAGLAFLPRRLNWLAGALLIPALFYPLPMERYSIWGDTISPLDQNLPWLQRHVRWGDAFIMDARQECGGAEEWDYYLRLYMPQGIDWVEQPANYRRVWYIFYGGRENPDLQAEIQTGRALMIQSGPARCIFRLYEAPPEREGQLIGEALIFHGADLVDADGRVLTVPAARHEGENLSARMWWAVSEAPGQPVPVEIAVVNTRGQSITTARYLLEEAALWEPERLYRSERWVRLRPSMRSGAYDVVLRVYDPATEVLLAERVIGVFHVKSY